MTTSPEIHKVRVARRRSGAKYVDQSPVYVRPGDTLLIYDLTKWPLTIAFEANAPVTAVRDRATPRNAAEFRINEDADVGVWEYEARLDLGLEIDYAEGSSPPTIIIER